MSGIYKIPLFALLDRELLAQTGRSLRSWAEERGMPHEVMLSALAKPTPDETILLDLATTLGTSVESIRDLCRVA